MGFFGTSSSGAPEVSAEAETCAMKRGRLPSRLFWYEFLGLCFLCCVRTAYEGRVTWSLDGPVFADQMASPIPSGRSGYLGDGAYVSAGPRCLGRRPRNGTPHHHHQHRRIVGRHVLRALGDRFVGGRAARSSAQSYRIPLPMDSGKRTAIAHLRLRSVFSGDAGCRNVHSDRDCDAWLRDSR